MEERLDSIDIEILEALGVYGPRNILELAKKTNIPTQTVRDRIKRLKSLFSLFLPVNIYHTFIGLKKAFVFATANPGHEKLLWQSLQADGYWLYLAARYDRPESFYAIYGIPVEHTDEFVHFLGEIKNLKIARNIELFWTTCLDTVNLTGNWFDHNAECWIFQWDKWIEDIENQGTRLPYTLVESDSYPQKADRIDIIILKELQKNAQCKLCDIARMLDVTPSTVRYHYEKHVLAKGLIEGYAVVLPHFEAASESYCFRFCFHDEKNMAKFALSLGDKPFVRGIGKIFGENTLFVQIYLPRKQFRGFTDSLSKLISRGLLKSYDYLIEDQSKKQAQTISYEFFEDNIWIYDHKKHLENLRNLVRAQQAISARV